MDFIAVCPDLFWRIEPGIDLTDKSEAEWKRAFELFQAFDQAKGIEDLKSHGHSVSVAVRRQRESRHHGLLPGWAGWLS